MYRPKPLIRKVTSMLTFIVVVALIFTVFIFTDNMLSGEQPMVEGGLLNPLTSKIEDLLDGEERSTDYPSGEQSMVEGGLLNPLTSKIDDLLDGEVRSTNYPPD